MYDKIHHKLKKNKNKNKKKRISCPRPPSSGIQVNRQDVFP